MQPGQPILPGSSPQPLPPKDDHNAPLPPPTPPAQPEPAPAEPTPTWEYTPEDDPVQAPSPMPAVIEWTASEYIQHNKQASWYLGLGGVVVLFSGLVYLITREPITVVVIAITAALFGVTASRKPATLPYAIDARGVQIGNKLYIYDNFKTFSVLAEGAINSIQLMPLKRFMPPITLYYPPDQEDDIVNALAAYLPHEDRNRDPVDRLMRKIRF